MIYFITLIVACCSIVYELLMAQTLSALMGNTIMRYSITIGVYLASLGIGAMLCEKGDAKSSADRLIRVEIWLSVIGGMAVFMVSSLDVFHRFLISSNSFFALGVGSAIRPILFFVLSHTIIVVIGILSGYEIPLLMALAEAKKPDTANIVLGIDYFGSLIGAVLFPLLLLPRLGLFAVSYFTGLLNAFACILLLLFIPAAGKFRYARRTGLITIGLLLLLAFTSNTQHFFLKKFYYYKDIKSLTSLISSFEKHPQVQEFRSPYQHIHIVNQAGNPAQNKIAMQYSDKFTAEPDFPKDAWLFLNYKYQFSSNTEEFYHETFVHVPIQWTQPPAEVLVLGAGDGIVVRELLKYKQIKRITLVDLDPKMLDLARYHPFLQRINRRAFSDPRVNLVVHDAFSWLQNCQKKFEAIYIDFPDPSNYDLAKLYSLEFYALVKHCLSADGFVAADLPGGERLLWAEYYSTLHAAGFGFIKPFDTLLERENEGILELKKQFLEQAVTQLNTPQGYPMTTNDPNYLRRAFRKLVRERLEGLRQRFVFLRLKERPLNRRFRNDGIPLYVLNQTRLDLSSEILFDDIFEPRRVNSVFRPTMPGLDFFSINFPY